jgi:hypothetical protein
MQYSKGPAMPIAGGKGPPITIRPMLRLLPRLTLLILAALLPLGLSGCADSFVGKGPMARFADLTKAYDKTLTKEQQAAAIAELQNEAKHGAAQPATTGSGASPAPAQN